MLLLRVRRYLLEVFYSYRVSKTSLVIPFSVPNIDLGEKHEKFQQYGQVFTKVLSLMCENVSKFI